MGLLYMNSDEHQLWEEYIAEAARMLGQECKLYMIDKEVKDLNHDPYIEYKSPIDINIMFESNPKPILKRMGWFTEDDELPYIAYITSLSDQYEDVVIKKNAKIEIPHVQGDSEFLITNVRGSKIDPLFWICKLVPYRYNLDNPSVNKNPEELSDTMDTGYSYLKRRE